MTLAHFQQVKKQWCPRAEDRAFSRPCRLRGQGEGLQIVFSRTPPMMQTNFSLNPQSDRHGHVLALATPKWLGSDPRMFC